MEIRGETRLHHPIEAVFAAYRDQLAEVAAFIPDIERVQVLSREEHPDRTVLHNEWVSDRAIPAMAQRVIKPEHLRWDDHATWFTAERRCEWVIRPRAFTDAVRCEGQTLLHDEGDVTRIELDGVFTIDLQSVPGVPGFVGRRLAPQLEAFIVSLIRPNLERTNAAIGRYLESR